MEIIISNKEGGKNITINGIDFDTMTDEFKMSFILKLIAKTDLKTTFLSLIKEKDFNMGKSNDENGVVTILTQK